MANQSEEEIASVTSNPDFRIFTTLRFNRWNTADICHDDITLHKFFDEMLLGYHSERLQASARAFGWTEVVTRFERGGRRLLYEHIEEAVNRHSATNKGPARGYCRAFRTRINVSRDARIDVLVADMGDDTEISVLHRDNFCKFDQVPPTHELTRQEMADFCRVGLDTLPTPPTIFTMHKTSHRDVYDAARSRADITRYPPTSYEVLLYNPSNEITEASLSSVYFYRGGRWITPAAECGGNMSVTKRLMLQQGLAVQGRILVEELHHMEIIGLSNAVRGFFLGQLILTGGLFDRPSPDPDL